MKLKIKGLFPLLVYAIILFGTTLVVSHALANGITIPTNTGLPEPPDNTGGVGPVADVIFYFVGWILTIFLLLAVISFVITGIQYLLAFGDTYKAETAKRNFTYSVIAVAVVGGALVIIVTVEQILSSVTP
jgi:Type IV secretion system pilin